MIKKYLIQAFQLLRQQPLFSGFYILGSGLSISMVMLIAIIYYIKIADVYPETNRSRTLIALTSHMQGKDNPEENITSGFSYQIVRNCFYQLKGAETVSAMMSPNEGMVQKTGSKQKIYVITKAVDTNFWKVFSFSFLFGHPFSETDFTSGLPKVVLSEDIARKIFNKSNVVGETIILNFKEYKICGVVKTPSYATEASYAHIWLPYTCIPGYDQTSRFDALGSLQVYILLHKASDEDKIKKQVDEYVRKYNTQTNSDYKLMMDGQPYKYWKHLFSDSNMNELDYTNLSRRIGLVLLVLLLVPALNLSGMISSRMDKRLPEMGIRKSFGATRNVLLSQIMWENLVLTCLGGILGLLISYGIIWFTQDWLLVLLNEDASPLPDNVQMGIHADMLFNIPLFLLTFGICVILNLLSALIPAYIALKKEIVYSLSKQK